MSPKEYSTLAARTESHFLITRYTGEGAVTASRLTHAALGLSTDFQELLKHTDHTNLLEEAGDLYWFLNLGVLALTTAEKFQDYKRHQSDYVISHTPKDEFKEIADACLGWITEFADLAKAILFYDAKRRKLSGLSYEPTVDDGALYLLARIELAVDALCLLAGSTPEDVKQANIAKLKKRYAHKFTAEAAVIRDTEAERAAIHESR
jgi:hypothetical protein